jgi:hypothetical protein
MKNKDSSVSELCMHIGYSVERIVQGNQADLCMNLAIRDDTICNGPYIRKKKIISAYISNG